VAIPLSKSSARRSSREAAQVFAELISRTSGARFSSQLLCLHLSGAILTRSNARVSHDVIDGCRDVLAETSRKRCSVKKFLGCQRDQLGRFTSAPVNICPYLCPSQGINYRKKNPLENPLHLLKIKVFCFPFLFIPKLDSSRRFDVDRAATEVAFCYEIVPREFMLVSASHF
jgi:hypothetical protein